jgi:YegS/Rv2252/BmrU family lipid kinase
MTGLGVVVHTEKDLGGGLEEFRAALADLGHGDPPWYEVSKSKKVPKKVRKLVEGDGVDRIVVWGGDGSVRRCIHTIVDGGYDAVSIGIMPAGTSNLLANNLGIPVDLREAARIAVTGQDRSIDVGKINGQHFAVMAGTGIDAMMIRDADDRKLKDRFGRLGYVWAGVRNTGMSPAAVEVEVDGEPWYCGEASGVLVANVGSILGGIDAFPQASPTDGRLDVGIIRAKSRLQWLRLAASALLGRVDRSRLTEMTTAEAVTIDLDRTLPWEVDGGDREREDRYKVRCIPGAVRIAQPCEPQ